MESQTLHLDELTLKRLRALQETWGFQTLEEAITHLVAQVWEAND